MRGKYSLGPARLRKNNYSTGWLTRLLPRFDADCWGTAEKNKKTPNWRLGPSFAPNNGEGKADTFTLKPALAYICCFCSVYTVSIFCNSTTFCFCYLLQLLHLDFRVLMYM